METSNGSHFNFGYDFQKFVDGSYPTPMTTITTKNETKPNPEYQIWFHQNKLLFGALLGTLSPYHIPLITQSQTFLVITSSKSKNNSSKQSRAFRRFLITYKPLKIVLTNLLHLVNLLTIKILLRKFLRVLMMIIDP